MPQNYSFAQQQIKCKASLNVISTTSIIIIIVSGKIAIF